MSETLRKDEAEQTQDEIDAEWAALEGERDRWRRRAWIAWGLAVGLLGARVVNVLAEVVC